MKISKLLVTVVILCFCSEVLALSPKYIWHENNGHYYALTQTCGNWDEAEAEAVDVGGHLVTINGAPENKWIKETFPPNYGLWIGLYQPEPRLDEPAGANRRLHRHRYASALLRHGDVERRKERWPDDPRSTAAVSGDSRPERGQGGCEALLRAMC